MMLNFLLKGLVIGPVDRRFRSDRSACCCIRPQTSEQGRGRRLWQAGPSERPPADAAYGCIRGLRGLTARHPPAFLLAHGSWLRLAGGVALCTLGVRTFLRRAASARGAGRWPAALLSAYMSTLLLTLANPDDHPVIRRRCSPVSG